MEFGVAHATELWFEGADRLDAFGATFELAADGIAAESLAQVRKHLGVLSRGL
jgi:hypothetical protein